MCDMAMGPGGQRIQASEAAGGVLAHDITEIRPGEFKGPRFKKGRVITENDIPHLARLGNVICTCSTSPTT